MNKTVLITGATKGIGLANSKLLASNGYTIIGIARTAIDQFPGAFYASDLADIQPRGSMAEQEALSGIPLGRIGQPEEIAATIAFLVSEAAGFTTGQVIHINDGTGL